MYDYFSGGLMTTVQRIMGQTNDMAKAKQATCHSWITHIKEKYVKLYIFFL